MIKPIDKYRISFEIGSENYDDLYRWVIGVLESTDYHMGVELFNYSVKKIEKSNRKFDERS